MNTRVFSGGLQEPNIVMRSINTWCLHKVNLSRALETVASDNRKIPFQLNTIVI